jgi:hypothetical protein
MRIRFLQTRTVQAEGGETFQKDHVYDLPEGSARRWIERNVAIESPDEPVGAPVPQGNLLEKAAKSLRGAGAALKKGLRS